MKLATVITTFRRQQYLKRAIESWERLFKDNPEHELVVSSAGYNGEDYEICKNRAKLVSVKPDIGGCNSLWLRGLYQTDAEYVHILHDDDFYSTNTQLSDWDEIKKALKDGYFPIWDGQTLIESDNSLHRTRHLLQDYGVFKSLEVFKHLYNRGGLTISPVCAVFNRKSAILALKRADLLLKGRVESRKGMVIGNDLWLFLNESLHKEKVAYFEKMLTTFGHHDGSETVSQHTNLIQFYDRARNQWKIPFAGKRQIIHCLHGEMYPLAERAKGINEARYSDGVVRLETFPKIKVESKLKTPFINDIVEEAIKVADLDDLIVYTNADIILCDNFYNEASPNECGWSHRININHASQAYPRRWNYEKYPGSDLFLFSKRWWLNNRGQIPNMLIGYEGWDTVWMEIMKRTGGVELAGLSYHIAHKNHWEDPANRHTDNGQLFNRSVAKDFLIKIDNYKGQYEVGVVEADLVNRPRQAAVQTYKPKTIEVDINAVTRKGLFFRPFKVDKQLKPIILGLQYWDGDKEKALRLADLLADIQSYKSPDIFLITYRFDSKPPSEDILAKLRTKFASVIVKKGIRNATGHPAGCNALWLDTMCFAADLGRQRKLDWVFTFEADCVPLRQDWLNYIKQTAVYGSKAGRKVIGHLNPAQPNCIEHINGNALFSTKILAEVPLLYRCPPNDPWDLWSVKYYKNYWQHSDFIFNAYRQEGWTHSQFEELQKLGHSFVHGIRDDAGFNFVRKTIDS